MSSVSNLRRTAVVTAVILAQAVFLPVSLAATSTGLLLVTATVLSTCSVATTPVAFGNYTTVQVDTTGSITVTCTLDVGSYNVALGTGVGSGSTTSTRMLTSPGGSNLHYAMYADSGRTANWGNVPGTDTLASTANTSGTGAIKTFTAYARLPAGQTSGTAVYTDNVVVTVNF